MSDKELTIAIKDLPMDFRVKYLGFHPAKGLWGMKHTRRPVDFLVNQAKTMSSTEILPLVKLTVNKEGIVYSELNAKSGKLSESETKFTVDMISYGVQDFVYTRVFSMIVVTSELVKMDSIPFVCHSFLCDSKTQAKTITYALAAVFQDFGIRNRQVVGENGGKTEMVRKKFSIDLRTPEEQARAAEDDETEA